MITRLGLCGPLGIVALLAAKDPAAAAAVASPATTWNLFMADPTFYNKAVTITPSDTADIAEGPTAAIYIGGAGVVVAVFPNDTTATFTCVAGQVLPVRAKRVNNTNTTATLLRALYQV